MVKPGYKQTEIGVIPEDWEVISLKQKYNITSSKRVFQSEWKSAGIPFYRAREIAVMSEGKPAPKELYISPEMYSSYVKQYGAIQENDILITGVGTLGKVYVVKRTDEFYFKDGNIIWLQWRGHSCSAFIKHLYDTPLLQRQVHENAGGSTVGTYTIANAQETLIPMPPLPEQERIAEALSDMDELIFSLEKLIAKKKAIKQGAMEQLLTGKTRLPGFSGEWKEDVFGNLFDILPNNAYTREQMTVSGKIKNVHYGDILTKYGAILNGKSDPIPYINKELETKKRSELTYLRNGDIIIADTAEDATVGKAVEVIDVVGKMLSGQHTFLCRPKEKFAPMFLGYYINSSGFHNQMLPIITGTKVSSISRTGLNTLGLHYPSIEEQTAISGILYDLDSEISVIEKKLAKAQQIKQGMMQQLLTGRIRLV